MFPLTLSSILKQKPRKIHKVLVFLSPAFTLANFIFSGPAPNLVIAIVFPSVIIYFSTQVLLKARRNKQKGVWIVAVAFLSVVIVAVTWIFYATNAKNYRPEIHSFLMYMLYGSVPLGLTAFIAIRFRDLYANLDLKVKERTQELNQSLENLRSTQSQLIQSEKLASLGALTAGIAHEIQNPLNFVNNFSEVNKELISEMREEIAKKNFEEVDQIAKDVEENEDKIIHYGKRAESIVKGMLLHSRGSSGHKEPTDINALCDEYLRLSYHGFRAKDKTFNADYKTDFDPNLPIINVVPQEIGRVLLNLINNAFYAVDQRQRGALSGLNETYQPTVTVSTRKNGNSIAISVKDNDPGIPEDIKTRIFQPFFTTKPAGQGTGLGLSLAYDIVKAHGGKLNVESTEYSGTEFTIVLS